MSCNTRHITCGTCAISGGKVLSTEGAEQHVHDGASRWDRDFPDGELHRLCMRCMLPGP